MVSLGNIRISGEPHIKSRHLRPDRQVQEVHFSSDHHYRESFNPRERKRLPSTFKNKICMFTPVVKSTKFSW